MRRPLASFASLSLVVFSMIFAPPSAVGQSLPRAAVLSPSAPSEADAGLASAFERVLRARLQALEVVDVEGTPALNLADLQLAVGCVAETDACMTAVAEQLGVDALVMPTIDRAGDAVVASLTYFVANAGESRGVMRRAEGERAPNEILAQVDSMVREIFDLPPPEEPVEVGLEPTDPPGGDPRVRPAPPPEEGPSPIPFVVGGVGIAALGTGVVFGLLSESTEGDYADAGTATQPQVDEAIALREKAETQALVANILLGAGGALVVAGAALFLVMGPSGDEEEAATQVGLAPWWSRDGAGITVAGRFGGAL